MKRYLKNWLVRIGLAILIFGSGPLWSIVLLSKLGLWPDPNPNPVGAGLLFFLTFFPGTLVLVVGIWQASPRKNDVTSH